MPILYATAANLTKRSDDDFILMETTSWYDNEHMIFLKDYQQVNTLDYLNLIDQDTPIISIVIKNEKNINLNQIINLKNLEHLSLESIESITFCDLNPSLKHVDSKTDMQRLFRRHGRQLTGQCHAQYTE